MILSLGSLPFLPFLSLLFLFYRTTLILSKITSAVESFKANGNKNGWGSIDMTNGDAVNAIVENGLRAPGVSQLPVCTPQEAFNNWANHGRIGHSDPRNYPCN